MKAVKWLISAVNKMVNITVGTVLILILLYGGYALWDTYTVYSKAGISDEIMKFKPTESKPTLSELQAINPDVCAWLTVDDTNIDYPVLQGENNVQYLNHDVYGNYSLSGSIFLDYRNAVDFTDYYSLVYGHHMSGGLMFGNLTKFEDETYFDDHQSGWLFVPGKTYKLEIFAYLDVDAYTSSIFNVGLSEKEYKEQLVYIKKNSKYYRDIGVTADDRIVALSTCSSAATNGRSVIVAKLSEYTDVGGE